MSDGKKAAAEKGPEPKAGEHALEARVAELERAEVEPRVSLLESQRNELEARLDTIEVATQQLATAADQLAAATCHIGDALKAVSHDDRDRHLKRAWPPMALATSEVLNARRTLGLEDPGTDDAPPA